MADDIKWVQPSRAELSSDKGEYTLAVTFAVTGVSEVSKYAKLSEVRMKRYELRRAGHHVFAFDPSGNLI